MEAKKCSQSECNQLGKYRYTWPGQDEAVICGAHKLQLEAIARAMGLYIQLIPTESNEVISEDKT